MSSHTHPLLNVILSHLSLYPSHITSFLTLLPSRNLNLFLQVMREFSGGANVERDGCLMDYVSDTQHLALLRSLLEECILGGIHGFLLVSRDSSSKQVNFNLMGDQGEFGSSIDGDHATELDKILQEMIEEEEEEMVDEQSVVTAPPTTEGMQKLLSSHNFLWVKILQQYLELLFSDVVSNSRTENVQPKFSLHSESFSRSIQILKALTPQYWTQLSIDNTPENSKSEFRQHLPMYIHTLILHLQLHIMDESTCLLPLQQIMTWIIDSNSSSVENNPNERRHLYYPLFSSLWQCYSPESITEYLVWNHTPKKRPHTSSSLWEHVESVGNPEFLSVKEDILLHALTETNITLQSPQTPETHFQKIWAGFHLDQLLAYIVPPSEIDFIEEQAPKDKLGAYHTNVEFYLKLLLHLVQQSFQNTITPIPTAYKLSVSKILCIFGSTHLFSVQHGITSTSKDVLHIASSYTPSEGSPFSISPLCRDIVEFLRPHFLLSDKSNTWKLNLWAFRALHFCVMHSHHPYLSGKTLELLIPLTLKLVDDVAPDRKRMGLQILKHLCMEGNKTHLRWYAQLLMIAIQNCILYKDVNIMDDTLSCAVSLLRVLVPSAEIATSLHYENVMNAILYTADYAIEVKERLFLAKYVQSLISDLGIASTQFLPSLLRMILSSEFLLNRSSDELFGESVRVLFVLLNVCWPRMKSTQNTSQILIHLEKSYFLDSRDNRQLCIQLIKKIRTLNTAVCQRFEDNAECLQKSFGDLLKVQ